MIIGLSGYAKSGKDTVAEMILDITKKRLPAYGYTYQIKKFSAKLKKIASILLGIPEKKFEDQEFKQALLGGEWGTIEKNPLNAITPFEKVNFVSLMSVREFLQKLGTDAVRDGLHPNAWVNALMAEYKKNKNWIITDVRFPNEAQAIKERGGLIIRIEREGIKPVNAHPSETALDKWDFDRRIENNGTLDELKESVITLLKTL